MAQLFFDVTQELCGDSLWVYTPIRQAFENGNDVTVITNERNRTVFEFLRDYALGCERLQIVDRGVGQRVAAGPSHYFGKDCQLPLRRNLPLVAEGDYLCLQPVGHGGMKQCRSLREVKAVKSSYSIGLDSEHVVKDSAAFHNKSFAEVAGLIHRSVGVVAVFSSIALLASLLGKKVVVIAYDGGSLNPKYEQPGHPFSRCVYLDGAGPSDIVSATSKHIGDYLAVS